MKNTTKNLIDKQATEEFNRDCHELNRSFSEWGTAWRNLGLNAFYPIGILVVFGIVIYAAYKGLI